ncbi:DUF1682-domain-containing protein [Epithele typhae]|uniref:DUF1682-domain-containing protein n=1 Tax=Epithele typhae TaxID=378194 RepID=UPI0020075EEE|nr:DUF1682-domain-containing protein [Epithele typhae]KAH9943423.1 DUF1682-domain-containing protein [Epithele typhae]
MATFLAKYLTPPMPNVTPDYDGVEYRWKFLTFRPLYEIYFLGAAIVYALFFFLGKQTNKRKAYKWLEAHLDLYKSQFSAPTKTAELVQDGYSDFFVFSTGRRGLASLHTVFTLRPRHDLLQYVYQVGRGLVELDFKVTDTVELEFTFKDPIGGSVVPECVWGIVAKDEMKNVRNDRWDLTFTRTTENSALPPTMVVMAEFADPYFKSLTLTDQPRARPLAPLEPAERAKRLVLSLALPDDPAATAPLVAAAFQLVDIIAGEGKLPGTPRGGLAGALRPETRTKLKKTREDVQKQIAEEVGREKLEEAEEEKAAAKKKARDERVSKLSAAEQQKILEREKKRMMRKSQGKVKMR